MFDRFKKWLDGDANWKSEKDLDRLAGKDAFLQDAMDGYRALPEADHSQAVQNLKGRLQKEYQLKGKQATSNGLSWKMIAAAASLVGVIGLFFWLQSDPTNSNTIVQHQPTLEKTVAPPPKNNPIKPEGPPSSATDHTAQEEPSFASEEEAPAVLAKKLKDAPIFKDENYKVDPSNIEAGVMEAEDVAEDLNNIAYDYSPAPTTSIPDEIDVMEPDDIGFAVPINEEAAAPEEEIAEALKEEAVTVLNNTREQAEPSVATARAKRSLDTDEYAGEQETLQQQFLNGKVVDLSNNEALIGVSIYNKNTGEGVVSDVDGKFQFASETALPWNLVASYTGYAEQELEVNELTGDLEIALDASNVSLDEVVVLGYSKEKKKRAKDKKETTKPVIGFKKMRRYIRNNLNYPDQAKLHKIQGGVSLRFYINEEGKPEQFTVVKALGSGCDQEAERLLREGPEWTPRNTWTVYTVIFNL